MRVIDSDVSMRRVYRFPVYYTFMSMFEERPLQCVKVQVYEDISKEVKKLPTYLLWCADL